MSLVALGPLIQVSGDPGSRDRHLPHVGDDDADLDNPALREERQLR
jgi:hypothetical protein